MGQMSDVMANSTRVNLRRQALPLWMALVVLIWLIAVLVVLAVSTGIHSLFGKTVVIGVPIAAWIVGIVAAWQSVASTALKISYSLGAVTLVVAMISFALTREPTTINIAGGLGIIASPIVGIIAGFLIFRAALHAYRQPVHSCWT